MSDLLFQSRKMNKDFLLTEQLNRTIDVNFRELADFVVKAYHLDEKLPTEHFQYHLFEGASGAYIGGWEMSRHYAEKNLFPLYDTLKIIETNKDMGKELILVEPKDIQKELDKVLDELSNEAPLQVWTKPMIKDYCHEKLYPGKFADMVYARVRRVVMMQSYKS